MSSQVVTVKILTYEEKLAGSEEVGYHAKISANILDETYVTNVYPSAIALYYEGIDPILCTLRMKALQKQRGFFNGTMGLTPIVEDQEHITGLKPITQEQMKLSGMEA